MPQNVRVSLLVLLCFLAACGSSAKGQDVSQLVTQLCSQRHQRRLDAVTCIGSHTKSEFPGNLAKCVRASFKAERQLKDFGLGALCGGPTLGAEGLDRAAPILADLGKAPRNLSPPAFKAMACALSYSGVKLFQIKSLIENCQLLPWP
ncbi:uncharacterized protein LOC119466623 [Dermacentor silvarum]|uniref:uncharacterized protein LOC119466623 n=1 Tax=Dermacentor silvarum TaxID=543639 RepID=UPI002100D9B9|nr:uncharacterized protein LOC119466623 [Dermacentor silvarum]